MTTTQFFYSHWHLNVTSLVMILLLLIFHFVTNGNRFKKRSWLFLSGLFLMAIVTFSPLDFLSHHYLFSAHMIEHITLLLIIPPMLLSSTDKEILENLARKGWFRKIGNVLFYPIIAWLTGIGAMWVWHIPGLFESAMHSPLLRILQTVSMIILGLIFIWPVYTPVDFRKIQPLQSSLYLFTACVGCTVLGIFITFAPPGIYTAYYAGKEAAILNLIRLQWRITPDVDQQMGGLIMWVPACMVYLTNVMIMLGRWYAAPEPEKSSGLSRI